MVRLQRRRPTSTYKILEDTQKLYQGMSETMNPNP